MIPKLIALDLDETTLNKNSVLSRNNRAAIEQALSRKIEIVIATGRSFFTIPEEILTFPGLHYAITGNGAAVYDIQTKKPILQKTIPADSLPAVFSVLAKESVAYEAFINGVPYAQAEYVADPSPYMTNEWGIRYIRDTRKPIDDFPAFIFSHETEIDSIGVVLPNPSLQSHILSLLKSVPNIYLTSSVPKLVEISHWDTGKHRGLQYISELLGISQEHTVAFGNGDNDAEMLLWAGIGIAVANGTEKCRAAADYITLDHDLDGVAHAFSHFLHL